MEKKKETEKTKVKLPEEKTEKAKAKVKLPKEEIASEDKVVNKKESIVEEKDLNTDKREATIKEKKVGHVKKYVSYSQRLTRKILLVILLFIIVFISFYISMNAKTTATLYYKEQSNVDYFVYLKENNYYESKYLKKDMQYIASLIDYIDVKFNYNFKMNENIDYTYKYYIESDVKVFEKENESNVIYQKKTKLVDNIVLSDTASKSFNINESLKINYNDYNNLVREFKSSYNINADSHLKLTLYVEVNGTYEKFENPIKANNKMDLTIPLSEQMLNINMDYKEINNSDKFKEVSNEKLINYICLGVGTVTLILSALSIIHILNFVGKAKGKKSNYQKKIRSILKEYDRVIIETKKAIDIPEGKNIIEVKSFEELLDVSDKVEQPILYVEIHKNQKCWFIVKHNEDIYRYIIKSVDLE